MTALRRCWPALRIAVAAAVIAWLLWRFGTDAVTDGLRAITPGAALAALGIGAVITVACALRWRLVAHRLGLPLGPGTAIADYYGSQMLNAVLPAGVLGDVHRALSHGSRIGALGAGVRAVAWERGVGQAVLVAVAATAVAAHPALSEYLPAVGVILLAAVLLAVALPRRWRRVVAEDARAIRPGGLLAAVALSLVAVAGLVSLFLLAARSASVTVATPDLLVLALAALLVMAVPLSVGGWGPREAFLVAAFGHAAADGLRTSVVYGVLALISTTPGVVVLIGRLSAQRGQVRAEGPDEVGEHSLALDRAAQ